MSDNITPEGAAIRISRRVLEDLDEDGKAYLEWARSAVFNKDRDVKEDVFIRMVQCVNYHSRLSDLIFTIMGVSDKSRRDRFLRILCIGYFQCTKNDLRSLVGSLHRASDESKRHRDEASLEASRKEYFGAIKPSLEQYADSLSDTERDKFKAEMKERGFE